MQMGQVRPETLVVNRDFYRAMPCISAAYAVMRCLSVCLSVYLSRSCIISKGVITYSIFFTILVLQYQTLWQYSDGDRDP